jgi:hypothetical protein
MPWLSCTVPHQTAVAHAVHFASLRAYSDSLPSPATTGRTVAGTEHDAEPAPGSLPVQDLLPQDVCVPAVLGEFAQYVEVHPAQRERAAPVAEDLVVQAQG